MLYTNGTEDAKTADGASRCKQFTLRNRSNHPREFVSFWEMKKQPPHKIAEALKLVITKKGVRIDLQVWKLRDTMYHCTVASPRAWIPANHLPYLPFPSYEVLHEDGSTSALQCFPCDCAT